MALSIDRSPFEPYPPDCPALGGFILIDRFTSHIGAGMIADCTRRAPNLHWQTLDVNKVARGPSRVKAPLLWFTGLSGAGK